MSRVLILIVFVFLCSCEDKHEPSIAGSVRLASLRCGKSPAEMQWMRELIQRSQSNMTLSGDIYAGAYDGQVVFIHQPWIMSCLACVIYDCDGNRLDMATLDHEKLRLLMDSWNRIYSSGSID